MMMPTTDFAVSASRLTRRFGDVLAVDGLDLRVRRGEVFGLLGLNGAGKSTTLRLLLGMLRPTTGHAEVLGARVYGPSVPWGRVGHLVETPSAWPELSVRENLEVAEALQRRRDRRAIDRIVERLGLGSQAHRRAGTLSTGNLQRLALARALLHEPELLVLDEPANGLDPAGVVEVRGLLGDLAREKGTTILLSSHILAEVERLATRIGIIHCGRLVEELDASDPQHQRGQRLEIEARDLVLAETALRQEGFRPVRTAMVGSDLARLELTEERALERPDAVSRLLVAAGAPPTRLAIVRDDLEQHFLRLTGQGGGQGV